MAVFKIITGKYEGEISIARVLHYILDPKKNPGGIHILPLSFDFYILYFIYYF